MKSKDNYKTTIPAQIFVVSNNKEAFAFSSYEEAVSFCLNAHFKGSSYDIQKAHFFNCFKQALSLSDTLKMD
jgi:hypothetical protein